MKAMMMKDWGEIEDLTLVEQADLKPGKDEVVIDVKSVGCNFPDILMLQGKYQVRPPHPFAPGGEIAGVVRELGEGVTHLKVGQRVLSMLAWGGYATQAIAKARQVVPIPDSMPFDHAAAFTIVYQTSYFALVFRAPVQKGQTLLVHGAAGGVGLSAVQIGKALGARVLATASSEAKRQLAIKNGAELAFDSSDPSWVDKVKEATDGRGADHIYDPIGGDIFDLSLKCIAFSGNLHVIGFASGKIPQAAMNRVLLKNVSLVGLHWGAYQKYDPSKVGEAMTALFKMYEAGQLPVTVGAAYPLEQAKDALFAIRDRKAMGKLVLNP